MSFWDNVKKFTQPYADDDYDDYDEANDAPSGAANRNKAADAAFSPPAADDRNSGSKVLNMSSSKPGVVLLRPISFGDALRASDDLKERKAVIVNLENVDKSVALRVVDFLSGCCYALNGEVKKISAGTYLFCPSNMNISGDVESLQAGMESYL